VYRSQLAQPVFNLIKPASRGQIILFLSCCNKRLIIAASSLVTSCIHRRIELTGAMIPGQFGPTNLVLLWVLSISVILTMSCCGMPSVMQTMSPISALIASSIPAAATGGGTNMALASAPVALTASATVANTGLPRCSVPAFFGFVPPTTFVPYSIAWCAWKEPYTVQSASEHLFS